MKRALCLAILLLLALLVSCVMPVVPSAAPRSTRFPPGYLSSERYLDDLAWKDYTDYAKYHYPEGSAGIFERASGYHRITPEEAAALPGFFDNFAQWAEICSYLQGHYDFDPACVSPDDYLRFEITVQHVPFDPGAVYDDPWHCYGIYLFDVQTDTLYVLRNKD